MNDMPAPSPELLPPDLPPTDLPPPAAASSPSGVMSLWRWLLEGGCAAIFLRPRVAGQVPTPLQLLLISLISFAVELGLGRLEIVGPARFDTQAWLSGWWSMLVFLALAWWVLLPAHDTARDDARPGVAPVSPAPPVRVATLFALWLLASIPAALVYQLLMAGLTHGWIKVAALSSAWFYWALFGIFVLWSFGVTALLLQRLGGRAARTVVSVLVLMAATGLSIWQFEARSWSQDYAQAAADAPEKPRLHLDQQLFETQQALLQDKIEALEPQHPGVADVYGLVFAPYATEDVFLRESTMVSEVLAKNFDARGRILHLLNHVGTARTHPWATVLNLQRAIDALAGRMDLDNDILVVYLTSHGGNDFKLAASHWPLEVEPLTPAFLRAALDKAGIRHRVIAVSACYSGGWVDVLANEDTLIMTAADATHTSYGCGRLSELTFFGRALFDEQLRETHSFEKAFARAVPLIRQREIDAGKDDGFSNPQIRVGEHIATTLQALEQRLDDRAASKPIAVPALPAAPAPPLAPASAAQSPAPEPAAPVVLPPAEKSPVQTQG